MKICSCCQIPKPEELFFKKRKSLEAICKDCKKLKSKRPDLVEKRKLRQKRYREENRDRERARILKWNRENNVRVRARSARYLRERRLKDLGFRIRMNLSSQLSHFVSGKSRRAIKTLLGCSFEGLISRFQSLFVPGMSVENYGSVWHVDHIKPCAKFDLTDPEQQKACFHFSNLQPLFALDNLRKSDNYD